MSARRLAGIRAGFGLAPEQDSDGVTALHVLSTGVSEEGGRAAFDALAEGGPLPTAVMCMSDVTAIGLMNAAIDAGLRLPEDLSLTGFDDIPAASWVQPRLTTVHQAIREKGERQASIEILPTRLVVRGSTAPPRRHDQSIDPLPTRSAAPVGVGGDAAL
jgi:alanine racemase